MILICFPEGQRKSFLFVSVTTSEESERHTSLVWQVQVDFTIVNHDCT
jgi:hypothetical protein